MNTTLTAAALAAAAWCASAPALAAVTHDFGTVAGIETASLSDTFAGAQTFEYTFEVTSAAQVFGAWSAVSNEATTVFNGLSGGFNLAGGSYTNLHYFVNTDTGGSFAFDVAPGSYTLSFVGFTRPDNLAGSFTTEATITALSAVPEPESYALLLAGVLATGFLARRRFSCSGRGVDPGPGRSSWACGKLPRPR